MSIYLDQAKGKAKLEAQVGVPLKGWVKAKGLYLSKDTTSCSQTEGSEAYKIITKW